MNMREREDKMIRYLSQDEKKNSRVLWEEAFPEDSRSFDDYYFKEKTKDNRILVREGEGEILSMIHQNPYRVAVKDRVWDIDYIVGVATLKAHRKQGHMRALLNHMLGEMNREGMPFCFLMPADERIYLPFDFAYIFDQPVWTLNQAVSLEKHEGPLKGEGEQWLNNWLSRNYQVYCLRDERYLECMEAELASEGGQCFWLYQEGVCCGLQSFWGHEKREQRELICDRLLREEAKDGTGAGKPAIMGRIVHLQHFMEQICLKSGDSRVSLEVYIEIEDKLIPSNHGIFAWTLNHNESEIVKKDGPVSLKLTISQLTQWLFGYKRVEEVVDPEVTIPKWCEEIQVLDGVFLDEVV